MRLTLGMTVTNTAATVAYLGLAVLGLGGLAAFFSHPALIAATVSGIARQLAGVGFRLPSRGRADPHRGTYPAAHRAHSR